MTRSSGSPDWRDIGVEPGGEVKAKRAAVGLCCRRGVRPGQGIWTMQTCLSKHLPARRCRRDDRELRMRAMGFVAATVGGLLSLLGFAAIAAAQDIYPSQPVRIV